MTLNNLKKTLTWFYSCRDHLRTSPRADKQFLLGIVKELLKTNRIKKG